MNSIKETPYRKFIILSSPRSGTHMLRTVLRNHPNVVAHSELFNPDFLKNKAFGPETPSNIILKEHIYRPYAPNTEMVGFIIHRSGTPWGDWPDLWSTLEKDKSIFVISLRRRNLLRRYLSYQVMRTFRGAKPKALKFDANQLRADFLYQEKELQDFDARFSGHPLLKVYYEDLCNDFHHTVQLVLSFLEVDKMELWPDVEGKPKRKLANAIENFSDLKIAFKNTSWESFFDEDADVRHILKPEKDKADHGLLYKVRSFLRKVTKGAFSLFI